MKSAQFKAMSELRIIMANRKPLAPASRLTIGLAVVVLVLVNCGCVSLSYSPSNMLAVAAHEVPIEVLGRPRSAMQQISISRLRQKPPAVYQLDAGDILGIYIQDVLGEENESPPVHFPETGNDAPALGFPVPIQEDGTIALPYVEPIPLAGLSLPDASKAIREAYSRARILQPGQDNIIVTLIRRRQFRVQVIREESGGREGISKRGTGQTIDLPAYENDVLHALNETGGLPGTDAKNEIFIIRGSFADGERQDQIVAQLTACRVPCQCPLPFPDDPTVTRIPIRFYPEELPQFSKTDILLKSGDVIYIPARDAEKFYTGGVLPGGEYVIPRDYDLDVLSAVAIARGQLGSGGAGFSRIGQVGFQGNGVGIPGKNPSDLLVIRNLPCGNQLAIKVDMNRALQDPMHRILIQPGDTLILRYKLHEEAFNTAMGLIQFNYFLNSIGGN